MFSFTPGSYDLKPSNVPESHTFKQHHKCWAEATKTQGPLATTHPHGPCRRPFITAVRLSGMPAAWPRPREQPLGALHLKDG